MVDEAANMSSAKTENENRSNRQSDLFTPQVTQTKAPRKLFPGPFIFQRLLIVSAIQLAVYLNKLYHDCDAVYTYYTAEEKNFFIVSIAALIIPTLTHALFMIGHNLITDDKLVKTAVTTKFIRGLLLIPWQIIRHMQLLCYVSAKICVVRPADDSEKEDLSKINRSAEIMEFFEDFYAGFLHLLFQLYIYWCNSLKTATDKKDIFLLWQLIASGLSILSLMIGVRRRDDGCLTCFLSSAGWLALFVSRIVLFVLVAANYGSLFLTAICLIHALVMSAWIFSIAIESYTVNLDSNHAPHRWTVRKRTSLALIVFLLIGIPSLIMWPFMFQLKEHWRTLKFLLIITVENLLLIALWLTPLYFAGELPLNFSHYYVRIAIGVAFATIVAVVFLGLYGCCKPRLTDLVVLHEMNECSAQLYGINYAFCKLVFKMPSTKELGRKLQRVRNIDAHLFERL